MRMVETFFRLLAQGRMRVDDMITHRFEPRRAAEAYGLLCTACQGAMGVVLDWTGE